MVQYGMVLSILAQETKRQRAEISSTAKHLLGYLDTRGPTNIKVEKTNPTTDPTTDPSTDPTTDPATDPNNIYIRHVKQSISFISWKVKTLAPICGAPTAPWSFNTTKYSE